MSRNQDAGRDSFVFYRSFRDAIYRLPTEEQNILLRAVIDYGLDQTPPDFSGQPNQPYIDAVFAACRPQIDANYRRWLNGLKGAPYGSRGGAPKGNTNAKKQPQNNPKTTPNVNVNVNENENVDAEKNTKKKFIAPSLLEVEDYCRQRGSCVDPNKFVDYYVSNGWMVGKNKMKDWRAAVRNWERNQPPAAPARKSRMDQMEDNMKFINAYFNGSSQNTTTPEEQ